MSVAQRTQEGAVTRASYGETMQVSYLCNRTYEGTSREEYKGKLPREEMGVPKSVHSTDRALSLPYFSHFEFGFHSTGCRAADWSPSCVGLGDPQNPVTLVHGRRACSERREETKVSGSWVFIALVSFAMQLGCHRSTPKIGLFCRRQSSKTSGWRVDAGR
jgi:hypothetical protein